MQRVGDVSVQDRTSADVRPRRRAAGTDISELGEADTGEYQSETKGVVNRGDRQHLD